VESRRQPVEQPRFVSSEVNVGDADLPESQFPPPYFESSGE